MANSVDPDETVPYEPSRQELHYLQKYVCWAEKVNRVAAIKKIIRKSGLKAFLTITH